MKNADTGAQTGKYGYVYDAAGNRLSEQTSTGFMGGSYNALVQAWPELLRLGQDVPVETVSTQESLL